MHERDRELCHDWRDRNGDQLIVDPGGCVAVQVLTRPQPRRRGRHVFVAIVGVSAVLRLVGRDPLQVVVERKQLRVGPPGGGQGERVREPEPRMASAEFGC